MFNLLTFFNNLRYLGRYNIKEIQNRQNSELSTHDIIEQTLYEIPNTTLRRPIVYDIPKSIDFLLTTSHSLARFGDGEIKLMQKTDIPFQKYDKILAERLTQILAHTQENLAVAIPANWYYTEKNISSLTLELLRHHHRYVIPRIRSLASKIIDFNKPYLDSYLTIPIMAPNTTQSESLFEPLRKLWGGGGELLLVGCKEADKALQFDIYDNAVKREFLYIPNKNAFSQYDMILKEILQYDKSTLIVLMAGPTACVLASDLSAYGYRALDLGHLAKSYDYYKRQVPSNDENIGTFFAPDE